MTRFLAVAALGAGLLVPASASAEICPDGPARCVSVDTCVRHCLPPTVTRCYYVDPNLFTFCL